MKKPFNDPALRPPREDPPRKLNYVLVYEDAKAKLNVEEFPHLMALACFCKRKRLTRYEFVILEGTLVKRAVLSGLKDTLPPDGENEPTDTSEPLDGERLTEADVDALLQGQG